MKKLSMSVKQSKTSTTKEFLIAYNGFSVGWHLAKLAELDPEMLSSPEQWERFLNWLKRHFKVNDKRK